MSSTSGLGIENTRRQMEAAGARCLRCGVNQQCSTVGRLQSALEV